MLCFGKKICTMEISGVSCSRETKTKFFRTKFKTDDKQTISSLPVSFLGAEKHASAAKPARIIFMAQVQHYGDAAPNPDKRKGVLRCLLIHICRVCFALERKKNLQVRLDDFSNCFLLLVIFYIFFSSIIFTSIAGSRKYTSNVSFTFDAYNGQYKTCIVFGFLSRSIEFDLRAWQRSEFQRQLNQSKSFHIDKNILLQQKFMIGTHERPEVMIDVAQEQNSSGDIGVLRIHERYRYLTANTWDSFHQILPNISLETSKSNPVDVCVYVAVSGT